MFLIPPTVDTGINPYHLQRSFKDWELIGFWQCSEPNYFSCGYVTPVFLGPADNRPGPNGTTWEWKFDYVNPKTDPTYRWVLFFVGSDDGSTGLMFPSREAALEWIKDCHEVDFNNFIYNEKYKDIICYHN